jgi:hypothetical protein
MAENIDAERERQAFEGWFGFGKPVKREGETYASYDAKLSWAAWQAARRTPSASIGEDGLPELPEGAVEFVCSEESDTADFLQVAPVLEAGPLFTTDQMRQYARDAVAAALHQSTMQKVHIPSDDMPPQAAQGVKTWQERVTGCGAVEGGHHGGGPRCGDEWYGGIHYCPKCQAKARDAEIEELRAQLARQSQVDEAEIYAIWDAAKAEAAMYVEGHCVDGEMHARHIMSAARPKVTAAPPLSSEQQEEKGEQE